MGLLPSQDALWLQRGTKNGAWVYVTPSMVNGTELEDWDWRDALFLLYDINPPDPPYIFDGYGAQLSFAQTLDCKKFILVTNRHKELHYGVVDLIRKVFTPLDVRNKPLIHTGHAIWGMNNQLVRSPSNNNPPQDQ